MSKENILTVQCAAVRGFHVYKAIWQPKEDEKLICEREENNKYDLFQLKCVDHWTERLLVIFPLKSRE